MPRIYGLAPVEQFDYDSVDPTEHLEFIKAQVDGELEEDPLSVIGSLEFYEEEDDWDDDEYVVETHLKQKGR